MDSIYFVNIRTGTSPYIQQFHFFATGFQGGQLGLHVAHGVFGKATHILHAHSQYHVLGNNKCWEATDAGKQQMLQVKCKVYKVVVP